MEKKQSYPREAQAFNMLENWEQQSAPDFFETRLFARMETPAKSGRIWQWSILTAVVTLNFVFLFVQAQRRNTDTFNAYTEYLEQPGAILNNHYSTSHETE